MPGSSSAVTNMIFALVCFSPSRLDRFNSVSGSTGPPNGRPGPPRPPAPGVGPPGSPAPRPGSAPSSEIAALDPQELPLPASGLNPPAPGPPRRPPPGNAPASSGATLNCPDMKMTPLTPTPVAPCHSGRPTYVPSGTLPAECAQINMRSGLPRYLAMLACSHWIMVETSRPPSSQLSPG